MQNIKLFKELKLKIADIVISVISDDCEGGFIADLSHERFIITNSSSDAVFHVHYGVFPDCNPMKKIFDSGGLWRIFQCNRKLFLPFFSSTLDKIVIVDHDFKFGDIYIRTSESTQSHCHYPLTYPLDAVLMINILSFGRGVLLHALGISDKGQGILFVGTSGAGKSTLASMLKGKKDVTILSDDRIIIRKIDGCFYVYGTPWHGDPKMSSPKGAPLEKIFFIKHAKKNTILRKECIDAASSLFVLSFPTFWDKRGMQYTLELLSELSMEVPCYELGFVPDESVLEFVMSMR